MHIYKKQCSEESKLVISGHWFEGMKCTLWTVQWSRNSKFFQENYND